MSSQTGQPAANFKSVYIVLVRVRVMADFMLGWAGGGSGEHWQGTPDVNSGRRACGSLSKFSGSIVVLVYLSMEKWAS